MPEDPGDNDAKRAGGDSPQQASPASSSPSDANEAEAARAIPGLDRLRTVTDQLIINIGVLGDVHGETVSATGQNSRPRLGDAISQDVATLWPVHREELQRLHRVFLTVAKVVELTGDHRNWTDPTRMESAVQPTAAARPGRRRQLAAASGWVR